MYKNRSQEFRSNQEKKTCSQIKRVRQQNQKDKFDSVLAKMSQRDERRSQGNSEKVVFKWLISLPLKNYGFDLTKQEFKLVYTVFLLFCFLIVYSKLNLYLWRAVLVKRLRQKISSQLTRV